VETAARALFLKYLNGDTPTPDAVFAVLRDLVPTLHEVAELWDPVLARFAALRAEEQGVVALVGAAEARAA